MSMMAQRQLVNNELASFDTDKDILCAGLAFICVTCAALAAGMTIGLLSLDSLKLKIKLQVGTEMEKKYAKRILPLLENHHLLLCTLLTFNAAANEALPIFLDAIVPSWAAVIISVTAVLICGEILPTALFTGPNQLKIAARFTPLIYMLRIVFYPISYPMAKTLDWLLGSDDDSESYTREEISAMMHILRSNATDKQIAFGLLDNGERDTEFGEDSGGGGDGDEEDPLSANEVNVITGVLSLAKKCIRDVCVPMPKVNMLSSDQLFDATTIEAISKVGHSRLPVFKGADTTQIVGFFLVKRLININPEKAIPLASMPLKEPLVVGASQSLLDVLNVFQTGHSHIALVSEQPLVLQDAILARKAPSAASAPIGILTIEDIFEAMLQSQIYDEDDIDNHDHKESASVALREMSMRSSTMNDIADLQGLVHSASSPHALNVQKQYNQVQPQAQQQTQEQEQQQQQQQQQKTSSLLRSFTEQPGRAFRAISSGFASSSANASSSGSHSAEHRNNEYRRALSTGNPLRQSNSGMHGGSENSSLHIPLLIGELNTHQQQPVTKKVTPSLVARYIKSRAVGREGGPQGVQNRKRTQSR